MDDAEERPAEATGQLVIREHEGFFTPKLMRRYFEAAVSQTAVLAKLHPLHPLVSGDEFIEYLSPRTQAAWIGFALGMRTVQRMAKAADTSGVGTSAGGPKE